MVKKGFIRLGILGAVLFILLLAARFTGAFQYYNIPTPANEPALKPGDKVFTSNLKQVQSYQFIVFTSKYADSANASYMPDFKTGSIYLYRLCGIDGDIIEMKNSTLFVNNKNFDESLDLKINT